MLLLFFVAFVIVFIIIKRINVLLWLYLPNIAYRKQSCSFFRFILHPWQHRVLSSFMIVVISSNIVLNRAAPASLKRLHRERDFVIVLHVNCSSSRVLFKASQNIKLIWVK